ncbi:hypothetical protein SESBI_46640 [Sesbania bispinosa]|nr:hypothetical protein SESBI_46640 [Sesbania bispinosa]
MDHPILGHQNLDLVQGVEKAMIIQNRASLQQVDHLKRVSLAKNIPESFFLCILQTNLQSPKLSLQTISLAMTPRKSPNPQTRRVAQNTTGAHETNIGVETTIQVKFINTCRRQSPPKLRQNINLPIIYKMHKITLH